MNGIDKIHTELRRKLADSFGTFQPHRFKTLLNYIRLNLTLKERTEATDMYDILNALEDNGTISPGKYDYLIEIMDGFDNDIKGILERANRDIQTIWSHGNKPWVSKYERKTNQRGLVLVLKTVKEAQDDKDIENCKNFFETKLLFECKPISLSDLDEPENELTGEKGRFYCVLVIVSEGENVTKVINKFKSVTGKPKIFLNFSTNENDNLLNSPILDADVLIVHVPTYGRTSGCCGEPTSNIEFLTDVLKSCYHKHHFEEMLVSLRNTIIAKQKQNNADENHCGMPFSLSTLTKLFYLEAAQEPVDQPPC